ncbi:MAG TPA: hypothetical protein VMZ71_00150 [Gemmataceae bacterium]|nr:hypothetical protein [Gemmataceae bacterium]
MADTPAAPEEPKSFLDRIGPAVAVGLTALAAVFGSMSAAALQQAMYWKSQAAQDQSKSTNQWSLAGFKRDRSLIMQTSAAQLRAKSEYRPAAFTLTTNKSDVDAAQQKALGWLTEDKGEKAGPPRVSLPEIKDEKIIDLRAAIEQRAPEGELLAKAAKVPMPAINKAIEDAEKYVEQTDKEWEPFVTEAAKIVQMQTATSADAPEAEAKKKALNATAATAAGFELEQRRYRAESRLNQGVGFLYDVRVKVSTAESDKHRRKSQHLSYAMLVAQIGAVAASLALSRKKGMSLWFFAGIIGIVAIGFGGYAFLPTLIVF